MIADKIESIRSHVAGNWLFVDIMTEKGVRGIGWDMDLAIEIHRNLTPDFAPVFAAEIACVNPYFIEDPVLPFSVAANSRGTESITGTVALAERNTNNWDVQVYVREDRAPWNNVVKAINRLENGFLVIPDTPGIGMELNDSYLATAVYKPWGGAYEHGAGIGMDGAIRHQ